MDDLERLNIFGKSKYSLSEEDRAVNGLLVLLEYCPPSLISSFFTFIGTPADSRSLVQIRDHIPYAPESIVDGELKVPGSLLVAIEAKIYKDQFNDPEQAERYLNLLKKKKEKNRILLLLSPDDSEPNIAKSIAGQETHCCIRWICWGEVCRFLEREGLALTRKSELAGFLIEQYLEYLESLGLRLRKEEKSDGNEIGEAQLHFLFGNIAAEKILLHIYHHGGGNIVSIAKDHSLGRGATQRVLERFVRAGILIRESRGRVIWYSFSTKSPLVGPLIEVIRIVYDRMSDEERRKIFEPKYTVDAG